MGLHFLHVTGGRWLIALRPVSWQHGITEMTHVKLDQCLLRRGEPIHRPQNPGGFKGDNGKTAAKGSRVFASGIWSIERNNLSSWIHLICASVRLSLGNG